jgi:hypothetical protein
MNVPIAGSSSLHHQGISDKRLKRHKKSYLVVGVGTYSTEFEIQFRISLVPKFNPKSIIPFLCCE